MPGSTKQTSRSKSGPAIQRLALTLNPIPFLFINRVLSTMLVVEFSHYYRVAALFMRIFKGTTTEQFGHCWKTVHVECHSPTRVEKPISEVLPCAARTPFTPNSGSQPDPSATRRVAPEESGRSGRITAPQKPRWEETRATRWMQCRCRERMRREPRMTNRSDSPRPFQ